MNSKAERLVCRIEVWIEKWSRTGDFGRTQDPQLLFTHFKAYIVLKYHSFDK